MSIYRKIRNKHGLTPRQMSKYLNLPLSIYYKIENGEKLEGSEKMFDKYIRKIAVDKIEELGEEQATELKLDEINETNKIDEFIENFNRDEYFKKFNIGSYGQLADALNDGYNPYTLQKYFSNLKVGKNVPDYFKQVIYDFFSDTNNIQSEPLHNLLPIGTSHRRKGKCKKVKSLKTQKKLSDDQIWFNQNLKNDFKNIVVNEYGNGVYEGASKNFMEQHKEIDSSALSRVLNGFPIGPTLATQLRNIFENRTENQDKKIIEENKQTDEYLRLKKENKILKEIINNLPNDVLLNLFISSKLGE